MSSGVHLLTYADRLGGDVARLTALMQGPLSVFSGVHVLPFFVPFDGADAGFDPVDHTRVDPRLGTWSDVAALAAGGRTVTADLVVNHASAGSAQFQDWLRHGDASAYAGMFLTFDAVFPGGGTEAAITAIYRPRAGVPFTPFPMSDGSRRLVWTSFMPSQVDLDVRSPIARQYLTRILTTFARSGVGVVRLDAIGYAVKTAGTDSFLTRDTLNFIDALTAEVRSLGMAVLVELHGHYTQQQAIAPHVDWIYDFALPPLLLHALATGDTSRVVHWFAIRPSNAITVLDTHDGIGVIDVSPVGSLPGLLSQEEAAGVFARASAATGGLTDRTNPRRLECIPPPDQQHLLRRPWSRRRPVPSRAGVPAVHPGPASDLLHRPAGGQQRRRAVRAHRCGARGQPARLHRRRGHSPAAPTRGGCGARAGQTARQPPRLRRRPHPDR